ncbi:MAG: hypothetical protein R3246_14750, partial [Acidimicrobiia bacterium]|nr:hypothetical protein [Acidimicrobiia bacterium]
PVEDDDRRRMLAGRYLAKYRALAADVTREFLLANALFEVVPTRVYAIIEREDEFSRRATRWSF